MTNVKVLLPLQNGKALVVDLTTKKPSRLESVFKKLLAEQDSVYEIDINEYKHDED